MIKGRSNGRTNRWVLLGSVMACLFAGAPAAALTFEMGGVDSESQYTGAGTGSPAAGILTFNDNLNGMNSPEPGVVTTSDIAALVGMAVDFEVMLGPNRPNGNPFNPATDNVKRARFLGTSPYDFRIYDSGTAMTLLAFNIVHIDVTDATAAFPGVDPDGSITLGDPTVGAASSLLRVSGGSLNNLVGGIGTEAFLQVQFVTITPAILSTADFSGYLNDNFSSGFGAMPISTSHWNLAINVIPEPSTAALLGFSLLGLIGFARRRSARRR